MSDEYTERIDEIGRKMSELMEEKKALILEKVKIDKLKKQTRTFQDNVDIIKRAKWYDSAEEKLLKIIDSIYREDILVAMNVTTDKVFIVHKDFFTSKYLPFVVLSIGNKTIQNMHEVGGYYTARAKNTSRYFYSKFNKIDIRDMVAKYNKDMEGRGHE